MAEINTIARPYAEALYRVATPEDRARWLEQLDALAAIAQNPTMQSVVGDPRLSNDQLFSVIAGVLKVPMAAEAQNFVKTLIDNGRLVALPEIAAQFRELKNRAEGCADALISSAFAMQPAALDTLMAALEKRFRRRLQPHVVIDASLIGGVRVVVGDEVLDSSVRGRLEQMRAALSA